MKATSAELFWSKVDRSGGPDACWPWLGGIGRLGYSNAYFEGKTMSGRRVALFLATGYWTEPHERASADCEMNSCVNPAHIHVRSYRAEDRFWRYVDKRGPDDCWPWTGGTHRGYGHFHMPPGKTKVRATRFSYELATGERIGSDEVIMHACDNPNCVNPAHLSRGTTAENHADMVSKGRHPIIRAARERKALVEARSSFTTSNEPKGTP